MHLDLGVVAGLVAPVRVEEVVDPLGARGPPHSPPPKARHSPPWAEFRTKCNPGGALGSCHLLASLQASGSVRIRGLGAL